MILGVRAHDYGKSTAEELARKISEKGFTCIQLALSKAISNINAEAGHLSPGLANHLRKTFDKYGIQIAVLGCYINLTHPDPDTRKKLLYRFKEHIRFARDFGCSIVGTETGSVNGDYSFHPDNHGEAAFQTLLGSVEELVGEAEKFGILTCIEGVAKHVANTPQRLQRVLETFPSNNLQVIYDPVNFMSLENYSEQERVIQESFDRFGDKIMILHAKDFVVENDQIKIVPAGKGLLNYTLLAKLLKANKPYLNVLLEDNKPETADASARFLQNIFAQA